MRYLFDDKDGIMREVMAHDRRSFFLDYDGTLTPIVRDPYKAFLPSQYREVIASLLRNEKHFVCIISGRAIEQLREFIRLKGIVLAGNHGMEIAGPDISYVNDDGLRAKGLLGEIAHMLKRELRDFEGVLVEDKGLTVSVHYRMLPVRHHLRLKESFYREMERYVASNMVVLTGGKKVLEVRPNVVWNKGFAVNWILGHLSGHLSGKNPYPIYTGDDETDEDAFRALKDRGLTVLVSPRKKESEAAYFVRDVDEVYRFLRLFVG